MRLFRRAKQRPTIEGLSRACTVDPANPVAWIARAEWHYKQGDYEVALAYYSRAIEADPDYSVDAYLGRGSCRLRLSTANDPTAALAWARADYDQVVARDPGHHDGYVGLALTYEALGHHGEALVNFDQAVALAPHNADPYFNRGLFHEQLGRLDAAIADFERAVEILTTAGDEPDYLQRVTRRLDHTRTTRNEHAQVVTEISRVLRLDPADAEARLIRAASLWALGDHERALDDFDQAVTATNREHPFALFRRASAYRHLATHGDDEAALVAIDDFEQMLALIEMGHGLGAPLETVEAARAALPELRDLLNNNDNDDDEGGGDR